MNTKLTETIADQWRGLQKFAADLAADIAALPARYNRGVKANLAILEGWVRAALLKLAEDIDLPAPLKTRRREETAARAFTAGPTAARRPGFRCLEPDDYERERTAENRFDISQFSGQPSVRSCRDPRPVYRAKLAAIEAVLDAPEIYARRVKRKLHTRKNRPNIKQVTLTHRSALPDLLQVSPYSDLGRYVWYNDSS